MTCVAVACSGGRDSVALLHAVASAARDVPGLRVVALHVHHGLNAQADAWLSHVERLCNDWLAQGLPVRCLSTRVHVPQGPGLSVEAEARRVRRSALADLAREAGAELILLAHHRRDQAETLLLQALRGGGLAGLAAMPRQQDQGGLRWIRPWLNHPREAIEAYVAHHGLEHVDDDSNGDPRFARNRLRLQVWPALLAAFPDAEVGLAHAAAHLGDALEPLADWQGRAVAALGSELDVVEWAAWSDSARRESLRHWYRTVSGATLGASWVTRLAKEVPDVQARSGVGHWPEVGLGLHRARLSWRPPSALEAPMGANASMLRVDAPGDWALPEWGGLLRVTPCEAGGVEPGRLSGLRVSPRGGGERFQAGPARPPRSLKKQFQAAAIPHWARHAPLFFDADALVFVPGLGLDARCLAPVGASQWALSWHPLHEGGPLEPV